MVLLYRLCVSRNMRGSCRMTTPLPSVEIPLSTAWNWYTQNRISALGSSQGDTPLSRTELGNSFAEKAIELLGEVERPGEELSSARAERQRQEARGRSERERLTAEAERLGVRQPSLYKHVDGTEALRRAMAARAAGELADDQWIVDDELPGARPYYVFLHGLSSVRVGENRFRVIARDAAGNETDPKTAPAEAASRASAKERP